MTEPKAQKITIPLEVSVSICIDDITRILNALREQSDAYRLLRENREVVEPIFKAIFGGTA